MQGGSTMIPRRLAVTMLAVLAGCSDGGVASRSCKVSRVADLPLVPDAGLPAVEATLDGSKVLVYIDTGAALSLISRRAADQFNLRPGPESGLVRISGIGGTVNAPLVRVPRLGLGVGMAHDLELPVAADFRPVRGVPVLGLFGGDFLSNYDVDLDMPGHRFRMYRIEGCGDHMHPLDDPAFAVPFELADTKVILDLKLNGKPVTAFLDSGASHTLVPVGTARQAGVAEADTALDRDLKARGVDESEIEIRLHRFGTLEIGDETMNNFRFSVGDPAIDAMLLGDDFLRFNHVWISYPLRQLYVLPVIAGLLAPGGH